jgi:hypothetical protein
VLLLTYYSIALSHRAGSPNVLSVPCENPSTAASPRHLSSPQRLLTVEQVPAPESFDALERNLLASTSDSAAMPVDNKSDSDIPDAVLLEVHIPLPSSVVVPDPEPMTNPSDNPVSHPVQGKLFCFIR